MDLGEKEDGEQYFSLCPHWQLLYHITSFPHHWISIMENYIKQRNLPCITQAKDHLHEPAQTFYFLKKFIDLQPDKIGKSLSHTARLAAASWTKQIKAVANSSTCSVPQLSIITSDPCVCGSICLTEEEVALYTKNVLSIKHNAM